MFDLAAYKTGTEAQKGYFREFVDPWLSSLTHPKSTMTLYKSALRSFWVPALGARTATRLVATDFKTAMADGVKRGLDPATVNVYLSVVRTMLETLVEDEVLKVNPAARVKNLKVRKPPPDPFSAEEMELILADLQEHAPAQALNYYEFAFSTGVRPSELIMLQWGDIDWHAHQMVVSRARVRSVEKSTKTYKDRVVDLNDRAMAVLRRQREHTWMKGATGVAIFQNPRTLRPWADDRQQREHYFIPALRRTGVRHRDAYNARHTYATINLMGGAPVAWVSKQLGHARLETTLRSYYRWIEGVDTAAAAATSNALFGQSLATKAAK